MNDNDLIKSGFDKLNQPYICPFCGKKECGNIWHIIKLGTLPRTYMKPKHYFYLYGLSVLIAAVLFAIYLIWTKIASP